MQKQTMKTSSYFSITALVAIAAAVGCSETEPNFGGVGQCTGMATFGGQCSASNTVGDSDGGADGTSGASLTGGQSGTGSSDGLDETANGSTANTGGSDSADSGSGSGGSSGTTSTDDGGSSESTGEPVCEPMLVMHGCGLMRAWTVYKSDHTMRSNPGVIADTNTNCVGIAGDTTVANGLAELIDDVIVCGAPAPAIGGAGSQDCIEACETMTPSDLGDDDTYAGMDGEVYCLNTLQGFNTIGLTGSEVSGSGTCSFPVGNIYSAPNGDPCPEDLCTPKEFEEECLDYQYASDPDIWESRGNHIYATLDYDWVQNLYSGAAELWVCDPSRWVFQQGGHLSLDGTSSLFYRLGLRDGDANMSAYEHDVYYDQVGPAYPLSNFADAYAAYEHLVPPVESDIHITFKFKRNQVWTWLHVDIEK